MWNRINKYRSMCFHASYGIPMAVLFLFDQLRVVDLSPLLGLWLTPPIVGAAGTTIAIVSVVLHSYADTRSGELGDVHEESK